MSTSTTLADLPSLAGQEVGTSDWIEVTQEAVDLFADATLRDVRITGTSLQLALLAGATLHGVTFERCDLREASLAGARLQDVLFTDCRLDGADLREARTRGCALRGCTLDGVEGLAALAGATMPWADVVASAGALAQALGIVVED